MSLTVHYDNGWDFGDPHVWVWYDVTGGAPEEFAPVGVDEFGPMFTFEPRRPGLGLLFKDGAGPMPAAWEDRSMNRFVPRTHPAFEFWCRATKPFVYDRRPRDPEAATAATFLSSIDPASGVHMPDAGGPSGLGATVLADGRVLFGLYQPNAGRVWVCGTFNDWQRPGHPQPNQRKFRELSLYQGYFGVPNLWLGVVPEAGADDEYKFLVNGGVPSDQHGRFERWCSDPFARRLGAHYTDNNGVVVDPSSFAWTDAGYATCDRADLILYELSVYGFTEGDHDIAAPGTFAGVTERIDAGYFDGLGVTALSLMPLGETSDMQGPGALGYSTSIFAAVERDFGHPDDLRSLVDRAHGRGLAVILDQVFNHTSNDVNPMWGAILEHPGEQFDEGEGGLYFNGSTPWGNRVATEKQDVQNLLIDVCKMFLVEYHIDGFRFDATTYVDHRFLRRLADELTRLKPSTILIAENLPNDPNLNRSGYDGFSQWSDPFHDRVKELLREDPHADPSNLGDALYFARSTFAAHTNNTVNYVESHDEPSVPHEVGGPQATKDRKGRLGLFTVMTTLGQPMIYMGQEFNVDRDRNMVSFQWPVDGPESNGFYRWTSRLIALRRRYPGLRMSGENPAGDGRFWWILGPWFGDHGHGRGRRVAGWRLRPNLDPHDDLVVLLNFEPVTVRVDLELGRAGTWVKLADLDRVNDIPPGGTNSPGDSSALHSADGRFGGFDLPSSSGFLYKWENG